ncbi:MAG: DUF2971 domain-containing protein [Frankiales bacterium]|nr:DUF2971 domain-containing protein [Frankiales bacterium]
MVVGVTEPEVLYHYTDAAGLLGIIRSHTIWATDAEFLNDAQEMKFGRAEVLEALRTKARRLDASGVGFGTEEESRSAVIRSVIDHLHPREGGVTNQQWHAAYVACFCEDGDLLSQWRGYAPGGGYAIGFTTSGLRNLSDPGGTVAGPSLVRVRYGNEALIAAVSRVEAEVGERATGHPGVTGFDESARYVIPVLASIKHAAFAEEREWRVVVSSDRVGVQFRSTAVSIAPYLDLPFTASSITSVVVGPGPFPELREDAVRRLVPESVEVRRSAAPFRG